MRIIRITSDKENFTKYLVSQFSLLLEHTLNVFVISTWRFNKSMKVFMRMMCWYNILARQPTKSNQHIGIQQR